MLGKELGVCVGWAAEGVVLGGVGLPAGIVGGYGTVKAVGVVVFWAVRGLVDHFVCRCGRRGVRLGMRDAFLGLPGSWALV